MGNLCACCLKSDQDGAEAQPVETMELLPRAKPAEKEVRSYDSILESATANFLTCKVKGKSSSNATSNQRISSARSKLSEVPLPSIAHSPPTSLVAKDLGLPVGASLQHQFAFRPAADAPLNAIATAINNSVVYQRDLANAPPIVSFRLIDDEAQT